MASGLLSRAFVGLRSIRASAGFAQDSRIYSSFFKRRAPCAPAAFPSLVSPTIGFIRCAVTASSSAAGMTTSTPLSVAHNEPVVSADWLHANLREPDVKASSRHVDGNKLGLRQPGNSLPLILLSLTGIAAFSSLVYQFVEEGDHDVLDASWYMPNEQRNPLQEYQVAHIPGALFFDVDGISDRTSTLPHMLPSEEAFAAAVSALGIHNKDGVIVYDGKGIFSAARVWWMFRVFGHDKVWVLDGGLPQWRASGYDVESSASGDAILKASAASEAIEKVYHGQVPVGPATFEAKFRPHLVWTLEQIKQNIEVQTHQQIDARSKDRFDGVALEPRKGIRSGHVPGSKCIPFGQMVDSSQMLLPSSELIKRFEQEGISLDRPVVTSCGTGVTACILALGLHRIGKPDVPVYDGSWTEWGSHPDTPVATA